MKQTNNNIVNKFKAPMGLLLVFGVPLLLAAMVLAYKDHFAFKSIANGQLLSPPLSLETLGLKSPHFRGQWQFLYLQPKQCNARCLKQIERLNNAKVALGKDQTRVSLRLISNGDRKRLGLNAQKLTKIPENLCQSGSVWLVDPKGFLVLHYPATVLENPKNAKGILDDARRLLRHSHAR